jgi:predicted metal-binding membrane protein
MGAKHGGLCVGCWWRLTATVFALGVVSTRDGVGGVLIAAEKTLPWAAR